MNLLEIVEASKTPVVDQSHIKGEKGTGYESGKGGPFRCDNCNYFNKGFCNQKIMVQLSKQPRQGNKVWVDPAGCCEYVERK